MLIEQLTLDNALSLLPCALLSCLMHNEHNLAMLWYIGTISNIKQTIAYILYHERSTLSGIGVIYKNARLHLDSHV